MACSGVAYYAESIKTPDDPYADFLIRLFITLVDNKKLPKYQFERRADAIITMFLPGILRELRGWNVELIAPEFPLKKSETFSEH